MKSWILALCLAALPCAAWADNQAGLWSKVGDWDIRVDPTVGHGCFMMGVYRDGTALRVGLIPEGRRSYLMLGNNAWRSLKKDQSYDIEIAFDNAQQTTWRAVGASVGNTVLLLVPFTSPDVWKLISNASQLTFSYHGTQLARLNLIGSTAAVSAVFGCQNQFGYGTKPDPFVGVTAPVDPFAQTN